MKKTTFPPISMTLLRGPLKAALKLFVRSGQSFQAFLGLAKELYIEVAQEELGAEAARGKVSRLSALTGLNRNEVTRLLSRDPTAYEPTITLAQRILGAWQQGKHYQTSDGLPRVLSYGSLNSEFHTLVRSVNQHLNPGTILKDLLNRGLVEQSPQGLKLVEQVDFSKGNPEQTLRLLGSDLNTLVSVVDANLTIAPGTHLHLRTEYDNIRIDKLKEIAEWLHAEGRLLHRRAREYLAQFDCDLTPPSEQLDASRRGRVVLGTFGFTAEEEASPRSSDT